MKSFRRLIEYNGRKLAFMTHFLYVGIRFEFLVSPETQMSRLKSIKGNQETESFRKVCTGVQKHPELFTCR